MHKPRDYDSELKALADKARALKERRVRELGALVMACKADTLDVELLAGALLDATGCDDMIRREEWRRNGAAFFQGTARRPARGCNRKRDDDAPNERSEAPVRGEAGAL